LSPFFGLKATFLVAKMGFQECRGKRSCQQKVAPAKTKTASEPHARWAE